MKRLLIAVAALFGISGGSVSAYYIEITIDLNHLDKIEGKSQSGGMAGNAGNIGGGMAGNAGQGGGRGMAGIGGGGMAGVGGRGMAGIGGGGMAGQGGGFGGRGMAGIAGGGMAGQGGGFGGRGMAGIAGGGMAGIAGGGRGMAGVGGGFGSGRGMGGGFNGMAGNAGADVKDLPPSQIKVRFELKGRPLKDILGRGGPTFFMIEHKWGRAAVINSELIQVNIKTIATVKEVFTFERKKALKDKTDKGARLALAKWVLKHGLVAEFPKIMEEVEKIDPNDAAVKNFKKIEAALKARPGDDEPSARWLKDKSLANKCEAKTNPLYPHYTLLTNSANKDDIEGCLKRLEENYRTFFYWFALQGKVLQVPKTRLVAVLLTERDEFSNYHSIFKTIPVEAAGFTARRDNVAVMYAKRLDPLYNQLDKFNTKQWDSVNRKDLLKGTKRLPATPLRANQEVLTLVQHVMEEETQLATVTHEGLRQLLAVTGLPQETEASPWTPMLARNLNGPEWARFGMASFFATPEGAYWPGSAVPSWKYLVHFKFLLEDKKLEDQGEVLEKVITDQYFREALATGDRSKLEMARATSWALAYYLASGDGDKQTVDKLFNYFRLVSKLPRDMALSKAAMKKAFAQAFSLADSTAEKQFAIGWFSAIRKLSFEVPGFWSEAKKARADAIAAAEAKEGNKNPNGGNGGVIQGPNRPNNPMGGGALRPPNRPEGGGALRPPNGQKP